MDYFEISDLALHLESQFSDTKLLLKGMIRNKSPRSFAAVNIRVIIRRADTRLGIATTNLVVHGLGPHATRGFKTAVDGVDPALAGLSPAFECQIADCY